ncbi:MAG: hypothetical protein COY69_02270 [Candidatus Magasanikbacteria bacterium CG_4_10_14_0_8_um_filter_32_14]|uniref:Glycerophosphoryl diester phosphodiesterase membrane domain-containing protein n=2 Tax=Candidatus Magasanikiibacteriota TaxID=1752731 RepID=A0A2M7R988_9BACT|nr:MAG: hypothetical protein AUJ23_02960 [Candidatus Magasanikbacteria bacterium CG1_02_32_51]PIY93328.1 MAG: hypothetical protein COY69_02270 [Candidatus Magasanikbacteria bacterium CG_4_10_14_0_8_um_filter_32_14]
MKEPNYREALNKGWHLAWHHKSLWVFGLFAAFLGQMGIFEYLVQAVVGANKLQAPSSFVYIFQIFRRFNLADFVGLFHTSSDKIIWLIWLIIIILGAVVMLTFVSVVSQGTIVHNTAKSIGGLHLKLVDVEKSWHESRYHFWSLFGLNLIRKVLTIFFVSFVAWGMWNASLEPRANDMFLFIFIFLLATIIGMVLYLWLIYAVGYVIVEEKKFVEAMKLAWRLFTRHWFVSLEIGFIFIILNIFLVLLIFVGMYILFLPSLFLWTMLALTGNTLFYVLGVLIGFVLFSLYLMLLGSIFVVFSTSTWTYLFMKMHKHGLRSHLVSLFHS